MTHGLFQNLFLLSTACCACISCSSSSRDMTIRSIPSGASLRVNGDYVGQAPVSVSVNRHKPVHVAADKPGYFSAEKTFYPEMTTEGAILWGLNNEKSKNFKTDTLTIRLKKAGSGAPPLPKLPAQW
ncbi:PEGA domain-containing protein [Akkermansia sp.]|uniref:PEGA domain-containing protein n=1 Tax=Akkermansia sp. TaxID=1872421 RepID=UPI0025C17347|nr:PEGA domain-containing protein [Akkermansia sp.]MCC8148942.1 PEGA domain-containing protein [Akkermansia sp.]